MNDDALLISETFVATHPVLAHLHAPLLQAAEVLCACHRRHGLILLCGNGGSAADCAHIAGELMKGFRRRREPDDDQLRRLRAVSDADESGVFDQLQQGIRAINLGEALALNTATANDQSHELLFAQSVFAYGRPGDVLMALSTSGNSVSVIRALQVAKAFGLSTIGLTGEATCRMDAYCDVCLKAPARDTAAIQEYHLPLYHTLCAMVEAEVFASEVISHTQ